MKEFADKIKELFGSLGGTQYQYDFNPDSQEYTLKGTSPVGLSKKPADLRYDYDPESQKYTQKMKKGGKVKAGGYVKSADGVAQRGKTKGRFV